MLLSMTGFGRSNKTHDDKDITVEIRSLNSKFTDVRIKLPQSYKNLEPVLRKRIIDRVLRGKVDVAIEIKSLEGDDEFSLNVPLFKKYFKELKGLSAELNTSEGDLMATILRMPNVVATENKELAPEQIDMVNNMVDKALTNFEKFRLDEGKAMEDDCIMRTNNIINFLNELDPFEAARVEKIRKRMLANMEEYVGKENIDANRFEQEILYYTEKIDVTEEKVRLAQHCKYFLEEVQSKNSLKGRKLSFITQEMGREINTLGSKANSSDIQRIVVKMKDDLEKIKEQVANTV